MACAGYMASLGLMGTCGDGNYGVNVVDRQDGVHALHGVIGRAEFCKSDRVVSRPFCDTCDK